MVHSLNIKAILSEWFKLYKKWITDNPNLISDIESTLKYLSFFTAERFNHLTLASELVYSLPNLIILFNDQIIKASKCPQSNLPSLYSKLKIWLTTIDYTEALFELSAKRVWGETGRWFIISLIQLLKVVMRLVLIYRYKERITQTPAIRPLNREELNENCNEYKFPKEAFSLKRSGKVVRTVRSSSIQTRTWTPLASSSAIETEELGNPSHIYSLKKSLLLAETMYVVKPLLHLGCLSITGSRDWFPWLLSFFIDVASLKIVTEESMLTTKEQQELVRRRIGLLLYLLRSPFYDNCSRIKILSMLDMISKKVPLARLITEPIAKYLPHWQNTYFYMWSM
ncbi:PREDICTED: peroxisomal membrane protein PEX16 [Ceratosolen solmsi marchali]|uniref:Peroxisomal membrane protein PEX16 n=1 Tax=Ceratosolen solmsi marchali TaxID=326594 RepID=A0AAJ6YUX7_9HYME|nr:PREDICTED: peroxisomal membrane protein PEX16 [Ceratosolen solmsi marchali]